MKNPIYILYVQSVYTGLLQLFLLMGQGKKLTKIVSKVMLEKVCCSDESSVSLMRKKHASVVQPENL